MNKWSYGVIACAMVPFGVMYIGLTPWSIGAWIVIPMVGILIVDMFVFSYVAGKRLEEKEKK